eukprot:jgi/Bigna1/136208/aug1.32_g10916
MCNEEPRRIRSQGGGGGGGGGVITGAEDTTASASSSQPAKAAAKVVTWRKKNTKLIDHLATSEARASGHHTAKENGDDEKSASSYYFEDDGLRTTQFVRKLQEERKIMANPVFELVDVLDDKRRKLIDDAISKCKEVAEDLTNELHSELEGKEPYSSYIYNISSTYYQKPRINNTCKYARVGYWVLGAGSRGCNGLYLMTRETMNGRPIYEQQLEEETDAAAAAQECCHGRYYYNEEEEGFLNNNNSYNNYVPKTTGYGLKVFFDHGGWVLGYN